MIIMKRHRLLSVSIIVILLLTGCNRYEKKTYILDSIAEDEDDQSFINIDRIYDYCYNVSTYGHEELAKSRTAWWSPKETNRIILNQYNNSENTNYINKVDFMYGFSDTTKGKEWPAYDIPLGVSANGEYMFFERRVSDARYLMLYDYLNNKYTLINRYDPEIIPPSLFEVVFCWSKVGNQLVYGWKYIGEPQHVVALDEDYYYNNWRYGKERVYSIKCYNVVDGESTELLELSDWKFNNKVYNYSLQMNDNGDILLYSKNDEWVYLFNILNPSKQYTINKAVSLYDNYWLGNQGIYVQGKAQQIMMYNLDTSSWITICNDVNGEVGHLAVSKDGSTLYFSSRQMSETYTDPIKTKVWDIVRYSVEKKELKYMYQGAEDVVGMELSSNGENLMVEMRDYSLFSNYKDTFVTRLYIFKSQV